MSLADRRLSVLLVLVFLMGTGVGAGCGGGKSLDQKREDPVLLKGRVSRRGSTPFTMTMLRTADRRLFEILPADVSDELASLDGMDVEVEGLIVQGRGDVDQVVVDRYDLLPFPSGERPIIGFLRRYVFDRDVDFTTKVLVIDMNGTRWIIEGSFKEVLADYEGSKVWVVGLRTVPPLPAQPHILHVSEYGIIRR